MTIFSGWDGYQTSLTRAVQPLTADQLAYRPASNGRSVGETAAHIALGRIDWFHRMGAPGSTELAAQVAPFWHSDAAPEAAIAGDVAQIVHWLNAGWQMIEANLTDWTIADLAHSYHQPYQGKTYAVSRQWVIWRVMAHDLHHGGQLSTLLSLQGIEPPDLTGQGGHIISPPLVEDVP